CWSMGPVGFSDLPRWSYFTSADGVLVNFYEPSSFQGRVDGVEVKIEQRTEYPVEGRVELTVDPEKPVTFALKLRIPDWCGVGDAARRGLSMAGGSAPTDVGGYGGASGRRRESALILAESGGLRGVDAGLKNDQRRLTSAATVVVNGQRCAEAAQS